MRSILVIRFSSLGDVILATPIVRQLRRTYPDAIIDVAVNDRFADVWAHNPHVRRVWSVVPADPDAESDAVKLSMIESLPNGAYDLIVDLQHNLRSRIVRKGLGDMVVMAPKHRWEKLAMVYLKRRPRVTTPIVKRYRSTVEHLPLVFDTEGPEVWMAEERSQGAYRTPHTSLRGRIALAPGARHATKRWPAERWATLCTRLWTERGFVPVLVGGADETDVCDLIAAATDAPVERADGATTLEQTVRVLDGCDALVSNDSGVMHLGTARRLPVVAVFGSTVPELGFAPYGVRHEIVQHDVACRPCSHIGRSACPKGHFQCMLGIDVDHVMRGLDRLGIFA